MSDDEKKVTPIHPKDEERSYPGMTKTPLEEGERLRLRLDEVEFLKLQLSNAQMIAWHNLRARQDEMIAKLEAQIQLGKKELQEQKTNVDQKRIPILGALAEKYGQDFMKEPIHLDEDKNEVVFMKNDSPIPGKEEKKE